MDSKKSQKFILKGIGASKGVVEGIVKVVKGIDDADDFEEGNILVAEVTDPSMVVMMNKAAAIITDKGGLTSHAAIISRELGIPCIVATKEATKVLKNGMKVRVDGEKGEVYLLS